MSPTSLLFAAVLLGNVIGQGSVVQLEQESLPFLVNGTTGVTITSPIGDLMHIQTLRLASPDSSVLGMSSILVSTDGSELLAVSDSDFVTLALQPTICDRYNVSQATIYPALDPDGQPLIVEEAPSVAVDGRYCSGGRGDLTIAYSKENFVPEVLRFRRGVESASTVLDVPRALFDLCGETFFFPLAAISYLNRLRGFRDELLALCSGSIRDPSIPRADPKALVYSAGAFNVRHGIRRFLLR
ncbi:hypothetical protein FOZ62_028711 [Perkinsus olseni]|nr:hypothetical protein FOZ62_028711 [Perkinsus olseni]